MPLRDHFRSPVNDEWSWDELHGGWPAVMVRQLVGILPTGFRSGPWLKLGCEVEFDMACAAGLPTRDPPPTFSTPVELCVTDDYEVRVYDLQRERRLVAAVEIVSPSNKDGRSARGLFIGKVVSLLQQGVSVSLVDLVTDVPVNLYAEVLAEFRRTDPALDPASHLYAATLLARKLRHESPLLDAWYYPMAVGQPLPVVPLWLNEEVRVMLPLEGGYEETCRILGIT